MGQVFVGMDWAEAHHDMLCGRRRRQAARQGAGCLRGWRASPGSTSWSAPHVEDPAEVVIGTETDRGLFVGALVAAGYRVLAVNPMSTSRYRERHSTSGAKSDAGDARCWPTWRAPTRHNHRPVAGDSELAEAVKVLARAHQTMIWTRQRQINQLRSTLREFYPAALWPSTIWPAPTPWRCWRVAPTPSLGRGPVALEDRRGAAPGRPPAPRRGTSGRDPGGVARRAAPGARCGRRRHGRVGGGPRRRHRRAGRPDRPPRGRAGRRVLSSTPTPKSSVPCQDWG